MRRHAAAALLAVTLVCAPRVAHVSGPVTLEARTRHFLLRMVSGPSIQFLNSEDEGEHHRSERERLTPELERLGAALETALARAGKDVRALVADLGDAPEVEWPMLQSDIERDLDRNAHSPYALRLLRRADVAPAIAPEWDTIMASSFVLVLRYAGGIDVRVRVAARPRRALLAKLDAAVRAVVKPPLYPLRLPLDSERAPPPAAAPAVSDDDHGYAVRTNRVEVRTASAAHHELARRLARLLDAEIASVKDGATKDFDRVFRFALRRGGYKLAETPVGGGITSPFLAEVPPDAELTVTLRTVETDGGGPLDLLLRQRMFELCRREVAGLKRHDAPDALDTITAGDWVLIEL